MSESLKYCWDVDVRSNCTDNMQPTALLFWQQERTYHHSAVYIDIIYSLYLVEISLHLFSWHVGSFFLHLSSSSPLGSLPSFFACLSLAIFPSDCFRWGITLCVFLSIVPETASTLYWSVKHCWHGKSKLSPTRTCNFIDAVVTWELVHHY